MNQDISKVLAATFGFWNKLDPETKQDFLAQDLGSYREVISRILKTCERQ